MTIIIYSMTIIYYNDYMTTTTIIYYDYDYTDFLHEILRYPVLS